MSCPFPGMDPYIERPEIWTDFHDRFVTFLCGLLQPVLRPKYIALTLDRLRKIKGVRSINWVICRGAYSSTILGRPRGRSVDSKPRDTAVLCTQSLFP